MRRGHARGYGVLVGIVGLGIGGMWEDAKAQDDFVSGSLNLAYNSHFVSYGADVWAAGTDLDDSLFNPSMELNFALAEGLTGILGTWWDVNGNGESNIGDDVVQEVDVWVGLGFAVGAVDVTVLYQEWMYASQSERIVDLILGFPHEIAPSVTLHGRVDGEELDEGVVAVFGIGPGMEAGDVAISFPLNVAFATDDFHGGDGGFAYVSAGVGASIPLKVKGDPSLDLGLTYYFTDDDVLPGNPDDSFVTASAGVGIAF